MKKTFKKLYEMITAPFVALAVHIGTSREINEHDTWDHSERERDIPRSQKPIETNQ